MKDLTISETAARLGVSYQRVSALIKSGELKARRVGRKKYFVRIAERDVERLERERAELQ